jgi:hypothetical protein
VLNFRDLLDRQLSFKDGRLILHQAPGLAFGFDEAKIKRFAIDPANIWTSVKG